MGKLAEVKAEVARLDAKILEANREVAEVLAEMRAAGTVYEEGPAVEREKRLRAATARRYLLQQRRDAAQFDLNCREAWGENWDAVAVDKQEIGTSERGGRGRCKLMIGHTSQRSSISASRSRSRGGSRRAF